MENKKIFCITAYCNTQEKIEALHKNILFLKKYKYPILLHSYLKVPDHISSLVDYLIIDKDNPVIHRGIKALWWYIKYDTFQLNKIWNDSSWTAINQIQQISSFLSNKDFDYHIFLNYDLIMSPDKFQERLIHLNNSFAGSSLAGDLDRTSLIYFILNKDDLKFMSENLSLDDYLSIKDGRMAEDYFHGKIMERNIKFDKNIRFSDSIQGFFGNVPQGEIFNYLNKKTNDFSLFFDQNCIILYNIKLDCDIEIIIDNKLKHIIELKANVPYFLNLLDSFKSFNIKYNNINEVIEYPEDSDHEIQKYKEND